MTQMQSTQSVIGDVAFAVETASHRSLSQGGATSGRLARLLSDLAACEPASMAGSPVFPALLDAIDVAVYTTDAKARITFYNEAAARLWGWHPPINEQLWCGSWRIVAPDGSHMPHDTCPMAICLKEGRAVRGHWAYAERPDGTRVAFAPFPTPLYDADGRMAGAVNVLVDITELRSTEARLAAVLELVPECVKVIAPDGALISMNLAGRRILAVPPDVDLGGVCVLPLVAEPDRAAWEEHHAAVCAGFERSWEYDAAAFDGRKLRIETRSVPILLPDGRTGHLAVGRDVTVRRAAEANLRKLQAEAIHASRMNAVGAMAAGLAHELNQPLVAMVNFASAARLLLAPAMQGDALKPDALRSAVDASDRLVEQALRAGEILRKLRAMIRRGRTALTCISPAELIDGAVTEALPGLHADHGGVVSFDLECSVEPSTPDLFGDRQQLQLVLTNLIRNAAEAVAGQTVRRVAVNATPSPDGSAVRFTVADTGPGLPAGGARLFEPHVSGKPDGMGIGLAVCKLLVEANGGSITAESGPDRVGTTFQIHIPASEQLASYIEGSAAPGH